MKAVPDMLRNIAVGVKSSTGKHYHPMDPFAVGGCLKDYNIAPQAFFRVSVLDFGIILNRATIEDLLKQIHCGQLETQKNPLCGIISESQLGERETYSKMA